MAAKRQRAGQRGRRRFLGAAAAAAGSALLPKRPAAQDRLALSIASAWPADTEGLGRSAESFRAALAGLVGEEVELLFHPAGEPIPPGELLKAVAKGEVDLAYTTPHFATREVPALQIFAGLPFGMTVSEFRAWLQFGGGQRLWERAYEPRGLLPFYAGSSGVQAGGWFREPVTGAAGLEGRRVRVAGIGRELYRRLGAEPVLTPPGEILEALKDGQLDGVDWIGPWLDIELGLPQVARYCYMPGFHEPAPAIEVLANRARFESIPPRVRSSIAAAAELAAARTLAQFHYNDAWSYRRLLSDFDVEVLSFPPELVERAARESRLLLEEKLGADPLAAETFASYRDFLSAARDYGPRAEQGYLNLRTLAFG